MMARAVAETDPPEVALDTVEVVEGEQQALRALAGVLQAHRGHAVPLSLVGPDRTRIELSQTAIQVLRQALPHLARGQAIRVVPVHKELSTQRAADVLNVSRPYLISLLEHGDIPYAKTGRHRRIRYEDLMAYKDRRDAMRRHHLDQLTRSSQEYGLDRFDD